MPELVYAERLREYVSNLEVRTDMLKVDFPGLDAFAYEVVMHFNVFSSGVKHVIAREVYTTHVIAEYADRIRDGNAQVL